MGGHEQEIRFCAVDGSPVAAAIVGAGPPLVLTSWWTANLEVNWAGPRFRTFLSGLADRHTVIRYDRIGSGLSAGARTTDELSHEWEVHTLRAVVDALELDRFDLLGISEGGGVAANYADQHPDRVGRLVTFGAYANGAAVASSEVRASLLSMVRAHWGLGSRVLADVWVPDADTDERAEIAQNQRAAATPETAAALLELAYQVDVGKVFERLTIPVLVMHRRDDRAVSFRNAVELAGLVPGARLLPVDGSAHPPWYGHAGSVVAPILAFLAEDARRATPQSPSSATVLSDRERAVLRLVAAGLGDAQIAQTLFLSPHTVHRHVANIRAKLNQPTRAAAAAAAVQQGLI
ncbi:alpha/beta fold hydrolase [Nocardia altamirensis]|uniref:alpha/beta fold hydrolase n=1 Tax=Nocardia altamirensis TaxID=472158 RepID=UPI0008406C4C|nr:alpha/beta fold hydrolase [Nocardia altamirensis]